MTRTPAPISAERLARTVAMAEIQQVLYRYCHAVDRLDMDLLKSCYHPDAIDDHAVFTGSAADYAEYMIPSLESRYAVTQHHMTNTLIEVQGATAYTETYFVAYHRLKEDPSTDKVAGGRYIDRFEERDGQWLIADRKVLIDWLSLNEGITNWPNVEVFCYGARSPQDHSYHRLPEDERAHWQLDR